MPHTCTHTRTLIEREKGNERELLQHMLLTRMLREIEPLSSDGFRTEELYRQAKSWFPGVLGKKMFMNAF